jgi:hypothetical protein
MALTLARDRRFYMAMAVAFVATVLIGFGPTYFFRPVFKPAAPLTPLMQVHGFLFSAWVLLLIVQTTLVAARRTDVHRRLGVAGGVVAALMVPAGVALAISSARKGLGPGGLDPLTFLAVPLGAVVMFAGFVIAGFVWRRTAATHKRLMLLATISIITPAFARFWFANRTPQIGLGLTNIFVVAMFVHDWWRDRRLHPVTLGGGLLVFLSGPIRIGLGSTTMWHSFARMLLG